jgi:hypothetical protein
MRPPPRALRGEPSVRSGSQRGCQGIQRPRPPVWTLETQPHRCRPGSDPWVVRPSSPRAELLKTPSEVPPHDGADASRELISGVPQAAKIAQPRHLRADSAPDSLDGTAGSLGSTQASSRCSSSQRSLATTLPRLQPWCVSHLSLPSRRERNPWHPPQHPQTPQWMPSPRPQVSPPSRASTGTIRQRAIDHIFA